MRTAYMNHDEVSRETATVNDMEDMTQQSFKDECDINTIVRRFGLTGQMPEGVVAPTYSVFADVIDFHTAMNAVAVAREAFDAMPAETRYKFKNDPQAFVEFCSDPKNLDEMRKMGLAIPAEMKDTTPTPAVTPAPTENGNVGSVKGGTPPADNSGVGSAKAS